jgi:hypothetical protein
MNALSQKNDVWIFPMPHSQTSETFLPKTSILAKHNPFFSYDWSFVSLSNEASRRVLHNLVTCPVPTSLAISPRAIWISTMSLSFRHLAQPSHKMLWLWFVLPQEVCENAWLFRGTASKLLWCPGNLPQMRSRKRLQWSWSLRIWSTTLMY